MKTLLAILTFVFALHHNSATAQRAFAEAKFHEGSNLYINGNSSAALASINEGLRSEPDNVKLNTLKKKIEEQKKKEEEQKKKEEQQKKEQEKKQKEQQNKDQQNKDKNKDKKEQEKKEQEKKDQEEKQQKEDQQKKEQEQKEKEQKEKQNKELPPDVKERLKNMKISEEKAKMLLEAMRNQEIQYLQQNKRQGKPVRKNNKPDW